MRMVSQLLALLTSQEQRNLFGLFSAVLVMAALEVVSVASIMPFLSVASDPSSIQQNVYLDWAYRTFGFTETHSFLIALGILALTALILSNGFIVLVTWMQYRYVWNRNHSISKRLLKRYLHRPYEFFITRNAADLSKNILDEAREVSAKLLLPGLRGLAKGIVALAIIGFLVYINPLVAITVTLVLGGAYTVIYMLVREKLATIGRHRVEVNRERYTAVAEAFGGIKEIKLRDKEDVFLSQYVRPSKRYAEYQALAQITRQIPRYILEAVAFGGVILITIYIISRNGDIGQVLPILGLYVFAGYRLMPALQTAFNGLGTVRYNQEALETLYADFHAKEFESTDFESGDLRKQNRDPPKVELEEQLEVENVTYQYPQSEEPVVSDVSLTIRAHSSVGFVGMTGSGKTTLIDLIMGLLQPQKGSIRVDGVVLEERHIRSWQRTIGYVPQDIYLADTNITQNVALGVPPDKIDHTQIRESLQRAQIDDFVMNQLSDGLETKVGERGIKLSGGQRQRIGIARALYHRPSVIVFDEATSSLDESTEKAVMDAVYSLGQTRTLLLVSHRLRTLKQANSIVRLENGRLTATGTFEDFVESRADFRQEGA